MEAKDITKETIHDYLNFRGVREAMIFGNENERVDPIDRHVFLRDMYHNLIGYRMENEGLRVPTPDSRELPTYVDMKDFDGIRSLDDAVINLKFLAYAKSSYQQMAKRRLETLKQIGKDREEYEH